MRANGCVDRGHLAVHAVNVLHYSLQQPASGTDRTKESRD
jgi:hypothetical protein